MIFEHDKSLILRDKKEILSKIKEFKNNNQNCDVWYDEYPIKKENILKFALLMLKSDFVDDMFYSDYAQNTLRALLDMDNVDNYTFVGHIFNTSDIIDFCYLMPYDNGEFYIKKVLCFNEEVDLFDCFEKIKNHINKYLEFVDKYSINECLFDNKVVLDFKKKFKELNQNN